MAGLSDPWTRISQSVEVTDKITTELNNEQYLHVSNHFVDKRNCERLNQHKC